MKNNIKKSPRKIPRKHSVSTSLAKIKTVDDLLTSDDINEMLRNLDKCKIDIDDLLIIWTDKKDGVFHYKCSPHTLVSLAVYMIEDTKNCIMNDAEEDD